MNIKYLFTSILLLSLAITAAQNENQTFYENGELQYDYNYADGKRDGITKEYLKNGKLKFEWNYKNDVLQGESMGHSEDGAITHWFYENNVLKEERNYTGNTLHESISITKGKRNGKGFRYYPSGKKKTEWVFKDDMVIEGIGFHETGEKKMVYAYVNGIAQGISKEYYRNGKLFRDLNYIDDLLEGITKEYDQEGKIVVEWNYSNNKLEGISKEYYPSGKLKLEWNYTNGLLNGITKEYYENGSIKGTWNYKDDVIQH